MSGALCTASDGPVLFAGIRRVPGAVQEHRGDERGGFLDADLVLGRHPGRGLEQAAEQEPQLVDRDVAAEDTDQGSGDQRGVRLSKNALMPSL